MKEIIEMVNKIVEVSEGQDVTFTMYNIEGDTLKRLAKYYDAFMLEPSTAIPRFRVLVQFEKVLIILYGNELKQVVTFK